MQGGDASSGKGFVPDVGAPPVGGASAPAASRAGGAPVYSPSQGYPLPSAATVRKMARLPNNDIDQARKRMQSYQRWRRIKLVVRSFAVITALLVCGIIGVNAFGPASAKKILPHALVVKERGATTTKSGPHDAAPPKKKARKGR